MTIVKVLSPKYVL